VKGYEFVIVIIGIMMLWVAGVIGFSVHDMRTPTYYADGYCAALGGVRLTDETCNVNGLVVEVKR
jgi:hypothetical protein